MSEDDPIEPVRSIGFDYPYFQRSGEFFAPRVYDAGKGEAVPEGFNAVRIPIDGGMRSDLNWQAAIEQARKHRADGLLLLWDIDLGLFSRMTMPFSDPVQVKSLMLSLQHFCQTIWSEFADITLGLVLYRGLADFNLGFPWDIERREAFKQWLEDNDEQESPHLKRLFCRDCCSLYLKRLVSGLPGYLQPMMLVDASAMPPRPLLQILHREAWDRFGIAIKGSSLPTLGLGWDEATSPFGYVGRQKIVQASSEQLSIGLCLPGLDDHTANTDSTLDKALKWLGQRSFRIVIEKALTAEWDGLDELVVISDAIGPLARRKLLGFCAAGGTVIVVGESLGLPNEKIL